jgi:hypothetical protein
VGRTEDAEVSRQDKRRRAAIVNLPAEIDAKADLCRNILNLAFTHASDYGPDGVSLNSRSHKPGELEAVVDGLGLLKARH